MPRLRVADSIWLASAHPRHARAYPTVRGNQRLEVAVVGGGITGAAVAYAFANAGVEVGLFEASRVGFGSTAASTALLMQEPDRDFVELAARFGETDARRIWQLSRGATRDFVELLARLRIDCELDRRDSVYYSRRSPGAVRLRKEFERRRRARIPARWLDASALRHAGVHGAAAIRTTGNAQVNPLAACVGLMAAAHDRGAHVFEHSSVERIKADPDGVLIRVNGADVHARRVVVATGYATEAFAPLVGAFRMLNTYVVATRQLDEDVKQRFGRGEPMIWDTARPYHYARWTRERRLLLGGGDRPRVSERHRVRALQNGAFGVWKYFERLFPALKLADIDFVWEGLFATTPDGLPYIGPHERYPNHLFALGYGGNGMTFGALAATLLLDCYRDGQSSDLRLFAFDRARATKRKRHV
jgi:glycine/D-amino acid oxidase-like deaminating enzyme